MHTTRSSAATNALLLGLPIDAIIAKAGWKSATTFVKHYMKPLSHLHLLENNPTARKELMHLRNTLNTQHSKTNTQTSCYATTPPLENLKPAFASLWMKDYKIKPQKLKNPSKIKSAKFCNEQLAKKMMLSAKKNSHTRLNQAAKKSSYHKTPSIDVGPAQPARRTKISKTGMSVKQKTRIPTSTQPHATPFTMSKAPVPPPTSSQCAANVVTQEQQQHPAIMAPPSVSQTEDIGVPKSSTKSSPISSRRHYQPGRSFG